MKKYIFLAVIFISCNSDRAKEIDVVETPVVDSLITMADSVNDRLSYIDSFASSSVYIIRKKLNQLSKEKAALETQMKDDVYVSELNGSSFDYNNYDDGKDKKIKELTLKLVGYEKEISILRAKLNKDSTYLSKLQSEKISQPETIYDKPNDNSLIIDFDRKIRGEGEIPIDNISVFIIPFNKNKVKRLMQYDVYCDLRDINSMEAKQAGCYEGKYFFNDIPPGKYLIKVCYYYGGFEVIDRIAGHQVVSMQVSPPIQ